MSASSVRQLSGRVGRQMTAGGAWSPSASSSLAPSSPLQTVCRRAGFRTSARRLEVPSNALPTRKPVGAFRGGFFGFLLGTSLGAYGSYYYLLDGYARTNDLLNEDMYALQAAVTRLHGYVASLDGKLDELERKRGR